MNEWTRRIGVTACTTQRNGRDKGACTQFAVNRRTEISTSLKKKTVHARRTRTLARTHTHTPAKMYNILRGDLSRKRRSRGEIPTKIRSRRRPLLYCSREENAIPTTPTRWRTVSPRPVSGGPTSRGSNRFVSSRTLSLSFS